MVKYEILEEMMEINTNLKGKEVKVIPSKNGDYTLGGISSKKSNLIIGQDIQIMIKESYSIGKVYYAEPIKRISSSYSFGGNKAEVEGYGVLNIHDRVE